MKTPYARLGLAISVNAVLMFFLTFALIETPDHFYFNLNRAYMAILMAAPMVVVMLLVMRGMYRNRRLNQALIGISVAAFAAILLLVRTQTPIGNTQFLRSMIPHHSSAVLMCRDAAITDPRIVALCRQIVDSQLQEIAQMKELLAQR